MLASDLLGMNFGDVNILGQFERGVEIWKESLKTNLLISLQFLDTICK